MTRPVLGLALVAVSLLALPAYSARIEGHAYDLEGRGLAGVGITLTGDTGGPRMATTATGGGFSFDDLDAGRYVLRAQPRGEPATVELAAGETAEVRITLSMPTVDETVTIHAQADQTSSGDASRRVPGGSLELLPLVADRFVDAMPLLPGVVRGPDGKLNFNGARASQSTLLVNGSSATDPLTGEFAVELPLAAIQSIQVYSVPYDAEVGNVTASVAAVRTRAGGDAWKIRVGELLPRLRFRGGTVQGIRSFTPRLGVSGPLAKGRAWISQGVSLRFVRSRVYGEVIGEDEQVVEGFDSFTQLDVLLGERHAVTATMSYFPLETDNLGLDTLHSDSSSPDHRSSGWNLAVADQVRLDDDTTLDLAFASKTFDVEVEPESNGVAILDPSGLSGSYFNAIDRRSRQLELRASIARAFGTPGQAGFRRLKVGMQFEHLRFDGTDRSTPIQVSDAAGKPLWTATFAGSGELRASDLRLAAYVQHRWQPLSSLCVDIGARIAHDRLAGGLHPAPRLAIAFSPFADDRTVLRASWGLFNGRLPLHSDSFEDFQERTETTHSELGDRPQRFRNVRDPTGLELPRSHAFQLALHRELRDGLRLRVGYRERRTSREAVVDRLLDGADGRFLLSSRGRSRSREFDITLRQDLPLGGQLFFSYAKSRSYGDLNGFTELYGDLREPLVLASESSVQPFDVPHRGLVWGVVQLPARIAIGVGIEWRSGFPYTNYAEDYTPIGGRNRGGRLPSFLSIDFKATKDVELFGHTSSIGVRAFNITDHFNPRDIITNVASPKFGALNNSRNLSIGLSFGLRWD